MKKKISIKYVKVILKNKCRRMEFLKNIEEKECKSIIRRSHIWIFKSKETLELIVGNLIFQ